MMAQSPWSGGCSLTQAVIVQRQLFMIWDFDMVSRTLLARKLDGRSKLPIRIPTDVVNQLAVVIAK
jgi:hypothetical protein